MNYLINGSKIWITNGSVADVAVVWAKDKNGVIRGFLLEKGMDGFSAPLQHGKWSLRASVTSELVMDNVRVPDSAMLPNIEGLKGPLSCLTQARYGISWGMVGAAVDCYNTALEYSKIHRDKFGQILSTRQMNLSSWRRARLKLKLKENLSNLRLVRKFLYLLKLSTLSGM